MKRLLYLITLSCLLLSTFSSLGSEKLQVHMLSGSKEYQSEPSLKKWAAHLKTQHGVVSTLSLGTDKSTEVSGLENLESADVLVVFCRRWELTGAQAESIRSFIKGGKPVLAIRTASHAFEFFKEFDKEILGGDYSGHGKGDQEVEIKINTKSAAHPILKGVTAWQRLGKPYHNPSVATDVEQLLYTRIENNDMPLAWTRTRDSKQRIFYTSLGIPADFENTTFIQLLDNALFWVSDSQGK